MHVQGRWASEETEVLHRWKVVQDDWLYWLIWKFKFPQFYWANPHQTTKANRFILEGRCKGESWGARDISGEEMDMTIWWLPTVWQSMTPPSFEKPWLHPWIKKTNAVDFAIPL